MRRTRAYYDCLKALTILQRSESVSDLCRVVGRGRGSVSRALLMLEKDKLVALRDTGTGIQAQIWD